MKEIQTRPRLVDSRFAGFARVRLYVPNNTHRSLPITDKLTVSGLKPFFHRHSTSNQVPSPAALRMIQYP